MQTLGTLLFIAAVGGTAVYVAQRPTFASGTAMAAQLLEGARSKGVTKVTCDDRIPIGHDGAVFRCHVDADDGSTALLEYTMDRAGLLKATVVKSTGPTGHQIHERTTRDPWNP